MQCKVWALFDKLLQSNSLIFNRNVKELEFPPKGIMHQHGLTLMHEKQ
jgi:hypothetical protein